MGIEGFTEWFLNTFASTATIITPGSPPISKDHILVDMNQLIHTCSRKAKNEEHLFIKIFSTLDKLFRVFTPVRSVFLVLDGPASKAKFIEQRKRRRVKQKQNKGSVIDKLQFTPGCSFMCRLKEALKHFCCARVQSNKYRHVKFYISGADVSDEGEIKIIRYIHALNRQYRNNSYLIVGSDADLILLGISTQFPNVHIYTSRQVPGEKHKMNILLSVDHLLDYFATRIRGCDPLRVALDFIVISVLMGNDYIPKFCGVNLNTLWNRYVFLKVRSYPNHLYLYSPMDETLNYEFLFDLIKCFRSPNFSMKIPPLHYVKHHERLQALKASGALPPWDPANPTSEHKPKPQPKPASTPPSAAVSIIQSASPTASLPFDDGLLLYDPSASNTNMNLELDPIVLQPSADEVVGPYTTDEESTDDEIDPELALDTIQQRWEDYDCDDHVGEYIHGILWILKSYRYGQCADYDWFFPYSSGPSYEQYASFMVSETALDLMEAKKRAPIRATPLQPYKFSLMILPGAAACYVHPVIRPLLDPSHPTLGEIFNGKFRPYIDVDAVEREIDKAIQIDKLSPEDREMMTFSNVLRIEFWKAGDASFRPPAPPTSNSRPLLTPYLIKCTNLDEDLVELASDGNRLVNNRYNYSRTNGRHRAPYAIPYGRSHRGSPPIPHGNSNKPYSPPFSGTYTSNAKHAPKNLRYLLVTTPPPPQLPPPQLPPPPTTMKPMLIPQHQIGLPP